MSNPSWGCYLDDFLGYQGCSIATITPTLDFRNTRSGGSSRALIIFLILLSNASFWCDILCCGHLSWHGWPKRRVRMKKTSLWLAGAWEPGGSATLLATWFGAGTLLTSTINGCGRFRVVALEPLGSGLCLMVTGLLHARYGIEGICSGLL